jgi:hypothetical protein
MRIAVSIGILQGNKAFVLPANQPGPDESKYNNNEISGNREQGKWSIGVLVCWCVGVFKCGSIEGQGHYQAKDSLNQCSRN